MGRSTCHYDGNIKHCFEERFSIFQKKKEQTKLCNSSACVPFRNHFVVAQHPNIILKKQYLPNEAPTFEGQVTKVISYRSQPCFST
jgi:hypothetical protein